MSISSEQPALCSVSCDAGSRYLRGPAVGLPYLEKVKGIVASENQLWGFVVKRGVLHFGSILLKSLGKLHIWEECSIDIFEPVLKIINGNRTSVPRLIRNEIWICSKIISCLIEGIRARR